MWVCSQLMWKCFHFIPQNMRFTGSYMPAHVSRAEWGVHTKTSTWYLDQGQTEITFNYKHSSHTSFFRVSDGRNVLWGWKFLKVKRWLLSTPLNQLLCVLRVRSASRHLQERCSRQQAELLSWPWPLSCDTLCPFPSHTLVFPLKKSNVLRLLPVSVCLCNVE